MDKIELDAFPKENAQQPRNWKRRDYPWGNGMNTASSAPPLSGPEPRKHPTSRGLAGPPGTSDAAAAPSTTSPSALLGFGAQQPER